MKAGPITVKASRWPWQTRTSAALLSCPKTEAVGQKYGWRTTKGMGRFGGGWNWSLGIEIGGSTIILNLLFGAIRITWSKPNG
jgi:hypothetical protein